MTSECHYSPEHLEKVFQELRALAVQVGNRERMQDDNLYLAFAKYSLKMNRTQRRCLGLLPPTGSIDSLR